MRRYPESSAARTASRVSSGGVWNIPNPRAGITTPLLRVLVSIESILGAEPIVDHQPTSGCLTVLPLASSRWRLIFELRASLSCPVRLGLGSSKASSDSRNHQRSCGEFNGTVGMLSLEKIERAPIRQPSHCRK